MATRGRTADRAERRGERARPEPASSTPDFSPYPRPFVAVDLVVLTLIDADPKVLLIRRGEPPFLGRRALPGGFVRVGPSPGDQGEDLDAAARRELEEETGLSPGAVFLEQLRAFGRAGRDPRFRVVSVAYFALVRPTLAPFVRAGGDAAKAEWVSLAELELADLAFDHAEILTAALAHVRAHIDDSDLAFELVPETFSIPELRAVFEAIQGTAHDPGNFRRRFHRLLEDGVIERAPGKRITTKRPALVYRFRGRHR